MSLEALKIVSDVVIDHQKCSSEKDKIKKELAEKSSELLIAKEENQELAVCLAQCSDRLENTTELTEQAKEQLIQKTHKLNESEKAAAKLKQMCNDFIGKNKELDEQLTIFQDVESKHKELLSQMEDYVASKRRVVELEERLVELEERIVQLEKEKKRQGEENEAGRVGLEERIVQLEEENKRQGKENKAGRVELEERIVQLEEEKKRQGEENKAERVELEERIVQLEEENKTIKQLVVQLEKKLNNFVAENKLKAMK